MKSFLALFLVFSMSCASVKPLEGKRSAASGDEQASFSFDLDEVFKPKPVLEEKKGNHYVPLIMLDKEVDKDSVDAILSLLDQAEAAKVSAVILEINTPGGSVPDGFRLAKRIENYTVPVICLTDGEAASMGYFILQSCTYRLMSVRSSLMLHQPSLGGNFYGNPEKWGNIAEMLKTMSDAMAEHMARRMFVSTEYVKQKIEGGKMWWLGWSDALKYGAVDAVCNTDLQVINYYREYNSLPPAANSPEAP